MAGGELNLADATASWLAWMDRVPEAQRHAFADIIVTSDPTTPDGMSLMMMKMIGEVVRGTLDRSTVEAVMPLIRELMTILAMAHQQQPELAGVAFRQATTEILTQFKPVKPQYTISMRDEMDALTGEVKSTQTIEAREDG